MGFTNNSTFGFSGNNNGGGGGGGLTAANNGLHVVSGTTVQLGGTLLHDTIVDGTSAFQMTFTSGLNGNVATLNGANTGTGSGILGTAISGNGVAGAATSGVGVSGRATSGVGGNFHSGTGIAGVFNITPNVLNTNATVLQLQRDATGGTAADGISGSIDFITKTTTQLEYSNQIKSGWVDATDASRLSQFVVTGAQNTVLNDLFTLTGNGAAQLNEYGSGTFTGAPTYFLAVDAAGNIIETAGGGGGVVAADNGLSLFGGNTVELGGPISAPSALLNNRYINAGPFGLVMTGSANATFNVASTGQGIISSGTSVGVSGVSLGIPISATNNTATNNNTVLTVYSFHGGYTNGAAGVGSFMEFGANNDAGLPKNSTQLTGLFTDVTNGAETGQFEVHLINGGLFNRRFAIAGSGQAILDSYGSGTFSGSPTFFLAVDSSGNVIETASGGGGIASADNGLSLFSGTTAQFGGPVGAPSQLLDNRYIDAGSLGFGLTIDGSAVNSPTGATISITAAGNGIEIVADNVGISATTSNIPGWFINTDATPDNAGTGILLQRQMLSGTPEVGTGMQIVFDAQNETLSGDNIAYIRAYMSDVTAGSESSQMDFTITTVGFGNFGIPLTLLSTGQIVFGAYGSGAISGAPEFFLAVDASGNVIEVSGGAGGLAGAENGLSVDGSNAVWGGDQFDPSASAAALLSNREIPFGSNSMFFSNGVDSSFNDLGIFISASEIAISSNAVESTQPLFNLVEQFTGVNMTWSIQDDGEVRFYTGSGAGLGVYISSNVVLGAVNGSFDNSIATIQLQGNVTISTVNGVGANPVTVLLYDTVTTELAQGGVNNGLSIDGNGNIVLGGGAGAALVTTREIPMNNELIRFSFGVDSTSRDIKTDFDGTAIVIYGNAAEIEPPGLYLEEFSTGTNGNLSVGPDGSVFMGMVIPAGSGVTIYQSGDIRLGSVAGDNGAGVQIGSNLSMAIVSSAAGTLTLGASGNFYVFTGTTTTWTLPTASGKTGWWYIIKNRGSGNITLSGNVNIYTSSSVASLTITPGQSYYIWLDGTLWNAE